VDQTGESSGTDGRVFFFYSNGSTDLMWREGLLSKFIFRNYLIKDMT
jgi:hypothetical protein